MPGMPHCASHRRGRDHAVVDVERKRRNVRLQVSKDLGVAGQQSAPALSGHQ